MKTFVAVIFLFIFFVATNVKPSYYYYWKVNQKAITKEYCENIDKPILACNGKCHLVKKVDQPSQTPEKKSQENPNLRIPTIDYIPSSSYKFIVLLPNDFDEINHSNLNVRNQISKGYSQDCLKPPILSA